MRRIHFDGNGRVWWHYPFWKPWGCLGCLGRLLLFLILFFIFMLLLSQFRRCSSDSGTSDDGYVDTVVVEEPVQGQLPPINDDDIIEDDGRSRRTRYKPLDRAFQGTLSRRRVPGTLLRHKYQADVYTGATGASSRAYYRAAPANPRHTLPGIRGGRDGYGLPAL